MNNMRYCSPPCIYLILFLVYLQRHEYFTCSNNQIQKWHVVYHVVRGGTFTFTFITFFFLIIYIHYFKILTLFSSLSRDRRILQLRNQALQKTTHLLLVVESTTIFLMAKNITMRTTPSRQQPCKRMK